MSRKWPTLLLLSLAELLGMAVWFSASAVVPALTAAWRLDESGRAWLTMSVQAGFVLGAFGSAVLNLADRLPARWLFAASALAAALATALIPLGVRGLGLALPLRFLTGMFLAGVYPVGMKIMATWTKTDRGLGIGLLVGALTLGSALPHLLSAAGAAGAWQPVLLGAAALAALGGLLAAAFVREGPYQVAAPRFNWRYVGEILRQRDVVLANLGYLGHMWELFALWAWIPAYLLASFALTGQSPAWASLAAFASIGVGGLGSLLAGQAADRVGRTTVTILSLLVSGLCCLLAGFLFGRHPALVVALSLLWGFAVVADSAQFSACVSELCDPRYTGTALTLQTSLGFLLTLVTIRLIPTAVGQVGWQWAFAFLALGPALGAAAMWALRRSPARARLAGGRG
jgi:MFS family permease